MADEHSKGLKPFLIEDRNLTMENWEWNMKGDKIENPLWTKVNYRNINGLDDKILLPLKSQEKSW